MLIRMRLKLLGKRKKNQHKNKNAFKQKRTKKGLTFIYINDRNINLKNIKAKYKTQKGNRKYGSRI